IVPISDDEVLVSSFTGMLYRISLKDGRLVAKHQVGAMGGLACNTLCSLAVRGHDAICSTRGGYAVHWDLNADKWERIEPSVYGSVNSVAFAPDDTEKILLGLGHYSLSNPMRPTAGVELASIDRPVECERRSVPVPGCCVDAIVPWHY